MDLVTLAAAKSYINKRIDEGEIVTGATPQQAAQIEQNKINIADLRNEVDELKESGGGSVDLIGVVRSVNGKTPDEKGNVDIDVSDSGGNGNDGITPHIGENGNWFIGTVDTGVPAQGPAGENGVTPHIGTNGNWYIGSANTGVSAKGVKGDNGLDGNGIKSAILNSDYTLTLTFDDGTTYTTPSIRGEAGAPGSAGKNGADGKDGSDGVGIASIKQTTTSTDDGGNNVFTVTLTNGTTATFTVKNGSKGSTGEDGSNGVDGGHYTPVVTQPTTDTMQISFTPSKSDMPAVNPVTVNLPVSENSGQNPPQDGEDGFSPLATVTQTADGATISITDVNGTTTATVTNGKDGKDGSPGKDGSDGQPGADGVSPAASVSAITGGHRITITDKSGTKTVDVMDGKDGQDGSPGADGNGIKSAVLNADYTLTLTFDDGTTCTTPCIRGATGASGPAGKDGSAGAAGKDGADGVGITSVKQTTTSTADGGNNVFTVTLTNGTSATFTVKNGSKGSTGATGATGPAGPAGSDATVTAESIANALGYVPVGAGTDSPLTGKKIVYDGDSICAAAFGYPKLIADKTACIFDNQAVGGARLCAVSDKHSVVNNLANLPTDGDIYCFEGGINDWWANTPVGTFSQGDYTGAVDAATIYGAMETICRYALTNFFGKAVCFVIVHKVQNAAYSKNTAGNTFWDYRKAMIDVCEKYSIPYYDAFTKSGLNGWNAAQKAGLFVSGDGTHPNEAAYEAYYVPQLISLFESIVPVGDYEAPAKPVTYTNVLKTAVGTDGQPYNGGKGWKADTYLSYDGRTESSSTNYDVTGWIPAKIGDVIRLKNVQLCKTVGTSSKCIVATVKSDFSALASTAWLTAPSAFSEAWKVVTNEAGTDVIQFTVPTSLQASLSYIRLCCGALSDASVITINEEID